MSQGGLLAGLVLQLGGDEVGLVLLVARVGLGGGACRGQEGYSSRVSGVQVRVQVLDVTTSS